MQINRHNYEEYFILYLDNELSATERRAVEAFAEKHPDLREELDNLLQYKLEPDTQVIFGDKEDLMKINGETPVTLSNYEEWFLLYADHELNPAQQRAVEAFLAAHPALQQEWDCIQKSRLVADETVVFANKELLYRHTEKVRTIRWWRIAAAAVLLISAGITTAVLLNRDKPGSTIPPVANIKADGTQAPLPGPGQTAQNNQPEPARNSAPVSNDPAANPVVAAPVNNNTAAASRNNRQASPKNESRIQNRNPMPVMTPEQANRNEMAIAENKTVPGTNNLPLPDQNPNFNQYKKNDEAIAKNEIPAEIKKQPNLPLTISNVTTGNPQPSDIIQASLPETGKKNKLRGFFRKVTRTFEKRTNIEATDGEDRLLIAGLSIKMK